MTNAQFDALFGGPPRQPEELLTQRDMDLAASIQAVTEEVMLRLTRVARARDRRRRNLCLAGGVALNCVANGKILRDGAFEQHLDPAGGRRRRRRARRGARRLPPVQGPAAHAERRRDAHAGRLSRARPSRRPRSSGACTAAGARLRRVPDDDDARRRTARRARRRQGGRLVPGPHGVRAARARRPLDPRRRALADACRRC